MKRIENSEGYEFVPDNVSDAAVKDESNRRASKHGYCTKNGDPMYRTRIMETVSFGKVKLNTWPRDKNGNLIDD